jgi:hypothetical protein
LKKKEFLDITFSNSYVRVLNVHQFPLCEELKTYDISKTYQKLHRGGVALIGLSFVSLAVPASATTITFAPLSGAARLTVGQSFVEGEFTYQPITQSGQINPVFTEAPFSIGNPAPALTTIFARDGDTLVFQFKRTDGGLFTFDSFDSRTGPGGSGISDTWRFLGQVSGSQTESFTYSTPFVSTTVWNTVTPNFNQPIDTLLIEFVQKNGAGALDLDNVNLTPVEEPPATTPEPGTILGLVTVGTLGALSRKRKG